MIKMENEKTGFLNELVSEVKLIFQDIWLPPTEMERRVEDILQSVGGVSYSKVIVTGETTNTTAYVLLENNHVLAISPNEDLRDNILLQRWNPSWADEFTEELNAFDFDADEKLLSLLELPEIVLVNLCVVENFPIPRLNLSIGTLVAYLRNQQLAKVTMIDMQMGETIDGIVAKCLEIQPKLIGMSVNFGQKALAYELLDRLFEHNKKGDLSALISAGNVIPTFSTEQFLERYPELIIGNREGEYTLQDLLAYLKGDLELENVRSIVYLDPKTKSVKQTLSETFDMRLLPTPALDTINEVAQYRGALTLEASRGCDYSKCTFCPRDHKLKSWRPLTADQTLKQIDDIIRAGKQFGIKPHIYFADEEFIGELPDGKEAERVIQICEGIMKRDDKIRFDLAARADSVYEPKRDRAWNVERLKMWYYCAQAGTDRVFIGVESGCLKQLRRYGKGTTPDQNIIALRMLSALGIELRIGFIMFDQMMEGTDDLKENMEFLERTDALMNPIPLGDMTIEELYDRLLNDQEFIEKHKMDRPVYSIVSYMLASMEVLMNAPYAKMIQNIENQRELVLISNDGKPDTNMGRYTIGFVDPLIGEMSLSAQKWIDSNFGIMYTIKSLYKVAAPDEKKLLYNYMVVHREISHYLLKYLVYSVEEHAVLDESLSNYLTRMNFLDEVIHHRQSQTFGSMEEKVLGCMTKWQELMERLVMTISDDLENNKLTDSHDQRLGQSIERWNSRKGIWELINNYELA